MDKLFDRYIWQARVLPGLIVLLPLGLAFLAWVPKAEDVGKPVVSLVVGAGALLLLAHFARDAGKAVESKLLKSWGGWPTVAMLRHRDATLDPVSKARYHARLQEMVAGVKLPTRDEEASDPSGADNVYSSCAAFLRAQTRDEKKIPLVFAENIAYGFRRNLLGLKWVGVAFALCGVAGSIWKLVRDSRAGQEPSPVVLLCLAGCLALLILWIAFVRPAMVRQAAVDYARRLIESIDQLK